MPDALSKTVPIWCAVLNKLLFEDKIGRNIIRTPREAVCLSEHSQIESRIADFVSEARVRISKFLRFGDAF